MPIPDTPFTRKEAYLNAIATGNASGIPETPYTREEMYLDAIAKGGGGGGGGSSTLSGLTDVDISNPTDGQTLVYNATSGKWENGAGGGASAYFVDCVYAQDEFYARTVTSSKTAAEIRAAVESGALVYIRYTVPGGVEIPDVNHVYPLNSMVSATDEGVTMARFSFVELALDGTNSTMISKFTLLTDNPAFSFAK